MYIFFLIAGWSAQLNGHLRMFDGKIIDLCMVAPFQDRVSLKYRQLYARAIVSRGFCYQSVCSATVLLCKSIFV